MARRSIAGMLTVDFFTESYRISGHISTRGKSVSDQLNDRLRSYIPLEDVYISRISDPGDIVVAYPRAHLRKDRLLFAIVPVEESFSKITRSASLFSKQQIPVWLALPMFELSGQLRPPGIQFDVDVFLADTKGDYITVLDGSARATAAPDITFDGEAFLVNQGQIGLFCVGGDPQE
jgi:hypothetical protein